MRTGVLRIGKPHVAVGVNNMARRTRPHPYILRLKSGVSHANLHYDKTMAREEYLKRKEKPAKAPLVEISIKADKNLNPSATN